MWAAFHAIRKYLDSQNFVDETIVRGDWFEMELTSLGFTPGSHEPNRTALARRIMRWRTSARESRASL